MNNKDYLFEVETVTMYLYYLKPHISPVKLHKSLYFLFAYYGAIYGQNSIENIFEGSNNLPKYLFNSNFEAWKSGVVDRNVYEKHQNNQNYNQEEIEQSVKELDKIPEVKKFIDEMFTEIDDCSDFKLIERNKQDEVWKESYEVSPTTELNNVKIIEEYIKRYI
jgi:uncharacterized phage-associated protein